jgi:hypothetical protein
MYSRLFRRETARHLRASRHAIADAYLGRRFTWLDAFSTPSRQALCEAVDQLADAVERDNLRLYSDYSARYLDDLLGGGVPPIVVLALGDLFTDAVCSYLTPDRYDMVSELLNLDQRFRQAVVYERMILDQAQGA